MLKKLAAACVAAGAAISPAAAVTIDFENIPVGTTYAETLTIEGATFSFPGGLAVTDIGTGNALCGYDDGECVGSLGVEFAQGARFLSFTFSGDTDPTTQLLMDINGTVLFEGEVLPIHLTAIAFANGDPLDEQLIEFTGGAVTILSFGIFSLDERPFVVDNFSFTPGDVAAVPEPASWAMLIAGFGLTGAALRRRQVRVAYA